MEAKQPSILLYPGEDTQPKREPNRKERRAFVSIQRKAKKNGKKK
jgi:hypothetical protein